MLANVEVDIRGRWDALAFSECFVAYRSHLVELGRGHWRVHAETPGDQGERPPSAPSAFETCLRGRRVEDAVMPVDWPPYSRQSELGARS